MRCLIAAVLALVVQASSQTAADRSLPQLLTQAGEHVRRFEQDFALVISDEDYRQHAGGRYYAGPVHRRTRAEMLFVWLPDDAVWLTVRNVLNVDGHLVDGSQTLLSDALAERGAERIARLRHLVNESARFNVGRTFRNFNFPTLVLSYFDPVLQPRFTFALAGRDRLRGIDTWKVNYVERITPTVIQGDGADRPSRGTVWIADKDGALVRTRLELTIPERGAIASASVEVDYGRAQKLEMWVPTEMRENYMEMRGSSVYENIGGEATYTNFRRFETSGRILPPQ